jgi:L-rhamnose mutarotase
MISYSGREAIDGLYHTIWKIDPRMQSEVEREEVILYPHVLEKLRRANLEYYSGHFPEQKA